MSSKHSVILDAKINTRTNHSNAGVSTTESTDVRNCVHRCIVSSLTHSDQQPHLERIKWRNDTVLDRTSNNTIDTFDSTFRGSNRLVFAEVYAFQSWEMTLDHRRAPLNSVVRRQSDRPHMTPDNAMVDRIVLLHYFEWTCY